MSFSYFPNDGGLRILSWHIDMSGFLHMLECDVRGDPDLSVGNLHRRADMRGFGGDLLAQPYLSAVSIVRRDPDLHQRDLRRLRYVSRNDNLCGHEHMRANPDISTVIELSGISVSDDGRTVVSRFIHLSRLLHLQGRELRGIPNLR